MDLFKAVLTNFKSGGLILMLFIMVATGANAQIFKRNAEDDKPKEKKKPLNFKMYQNSSGLNIGYQRGKFNYLEIGAEKNWRKWSLTKPRVYAVSAMAEYNIWENSLVLRGSAYTKSGKFFTYGINGGYFTDFNNGKFGVGPAVGIKFLGFHGQAGYNILLGKQPLESVNTLYLSLGYFLTLHSEIEVEKRGKRSRLLKF